MGGFEVKNNIALTGTVCIASFKVIGELQRETCVIHVPHRLLEWTNTWTTLASKELSTFVASSSSSAASVVSGVVCIEYSLVPRLMRGWREKSLVHTVCACSDFQEFGNSHNIRSVTLTSAR